MSSDMIKGLPYEAYSVGPNVVIVKEPFNSIMDATQAAVQLSIHLPEHNKIMINSVTPDYGVHAGMPFPVIQNMKYILKMEKE